VIINYCNMFSIHSWTHFSGIFTKLLAIFTKYYWMHNFFKWCKWTNCVNV